MYEIRNKIITLCFLLTLPINIHAFELVRDVELEEFTIHRDSWLY